MFVRYTFDFAFRILLVILPFMTVLTVFTKERLGIPGFSFVKEILLFLMLIILLWEHFTGKQKIQFSKYDFWIGAYILIMIIITIFTTGAKGIVYGGRYDFAFLIAFLTLYHGRVFLEKPISYYLHLFLVSGGVMLLISFLLKWPFSEDILLYLGYSGNPSNWQFGSSIPIFHGVDGANVRRLQGLLDGPNTMGAFLLMYIGVFLYYFRNYKDWYFVLGMVTAVLFVGIIYTYSRSALIGFFAGVGIVILFLLPVIYRKYKAQFFSLLILGVLGLGFVFLQYSGNIQAILQRGGSTNGHMERMKVGIERFLEYPLGQGLGAAGPAYRYVQDLENKDRKEIEELDRFYIPESWYIQQMVEGGIFGIFSFLMVIGVIALVLLRKHVLLLGMFISILFMNLLLHTFESSVVALSLFSLVGIILSPKREVTHDKY